MEGKIEGEGSPFSFLGHQSSLDKAKVVIIPVPYEGTTTYRPGTRFGPQAIISASRHLETFDLEFIETPIHSYIHTLGEIDVLNDPCLMVDRVYEVSKQVLSLGMVPVLIGGEHSLTLGQFKAVYERWKEVSLLQLDAHLDLRQSYQGSPFNHACVMQRIYELTSSVVHVGARSVAQEEMEEVKRRGYKVIFAEECDGREEISGYLGKMVYITVDLDVLDPAEMPSIGTPEPGGLRWKDLLEILRCVSKSSRIVGFDVMELTPIPGMEAPNFLAAKLIYKLIGYTLRGNRDAL